MKIQQWKKARRGWHGVPLAGALPAMLLSGVSPETDVESTANTAAWPAKIG